MEEFHNVNLENEARQEKLRRAIAGLSLYLMSGCAAPAQVRAEEQLMRAASDAPVGELILRLVEGVKAEDCADIAPDVFKQMSHDLENEWSVAMKKSHGMWHLANFQRGEEESVAQHGLEQTEGIDAVCHLHTHPLANEIDGEVLNQKKYNNRVLTHAEIEGLKEQIGMIKSDAIPAPFYGPLWEDLKNIVEHSEYYQGKSEYIPVVHLVASPAGTWTLSIEDNPLLREGPIIAGQKIQKMDEMKEKNLDTGEKNTYWEYTIGYMKSRWLLPGAFVDEYQKTNDATKISKFHLEREKASHSMITSAEKLGIKIEFKPYPEN